MDRLSQPAAFIYLFRVCEDLYCKHWRVLTIRCGLYPHGVYGSVPETREICIIIRTVEIYKCLEGKELRWMEGASLTAAHFTVESGSEMDSYFINLPSESVKKKCNAIWVENLLLNSQCHIWWTFDFTWNYWCMSIVTFSPWVFPSYSLIQACHKCFLGHSCFFHVCWHWFSSNGASWTECVLQLWPLKPDPFDSLQFVKNFTCPAPPRFSLMRTTFNAESWWYLGICIPCGSACDWPVCESPDPLTLVGTHSLLGISLQD